MYQKLSLFILIALIAVGNCQINPINDRRPAFPQIIEGHYGKCCHVQYVFSYDISGSMNWYGNWPLVLSMFANWRNWLINQRANG